MTAIDVSPSELFAHYAPLVVGLNSGCTYVTADTGAAAARFLKSRLTAPGAIQSSQRAHVFPLGLRFVYVMHLYPVDNRYRRCSYRHIPSGYCRKPTVGTKLTMAVGVGLRTARATVVVAIWDQSVVYCVEKRYARLLHSRARMN